MTLVLVDLLQSTGTKGGIEAYVRSLYTEIGKSSSDFSFLGLANKESNLSDLSKWFPGEIMPSRISGENRWDWARGELFGVSRVAEEVNADLIHCPAMLGPVKSKAPTVLTVHDLSYFTHPHLMKTPLYTEPVKWMEKRAARNATSVIAISQSTADLIPTKLGIDSVKVHTVLSAGRHIEIQRKPTSPPFFLAMGQRSPYKSLETCIRAWAHIPPAERPTLIITGSHGTDPLVPLVQQLKLEASVKLLNWVSDSDMNELMSGATAIIETTIAAGFGMPAVEAMGAGVPVIVSDIPVFREIIGDSGIYFQAGDDRDLAITVMSVTNETLKSKAEAGLLRARSFSWEQTVKGTLEVFRSTIGSA